MKLPIAFLGLCALITAAGVAHGDDSSIQLQGSIMQQYKAFHPGDQWLDTDGNHIQAHGGGILVDGDTYYWYGENKAGETINDHRVDVIGVSCYSSKDLYNWKYEGLALEAVQDDPEHDLHPSRVVERPKVLYNEKTGKYVMWMHIDAPDYSLGHAGVAVSDSPTGPFRYLGSMAPNGSPSRDMTLYKDKDGAAYLIFGSGWHTHIQIARLDDAFIKPTGDYIEILHRPGPPTGREAPAIFERDGLYHLITSGTTGWSQNPAEYAVADAIMGEWKVMGDPCVGEGRELTFESQSTFVLPVPGRDDAWIFMADRWKNTDLGDSRYVWLPIQFDGDKLRIEWMDEWSLSFFDK